MGAGCMKRGQYILTPWGVGLSLDTEFISEMCEIKRLHMRYITPRGRLLCIVLLTCSVHWKGTALDLHIKRARDHPLASKQPLS